MTSDVVHPLDAFFDMGGHAFVLRIVNTFSENVERQHAAACSALQQSNWDVVAQIGHTLRSSAATVGANRMATHFLHLEQAASVKDAAAAQALLRAIYSLMLQWRQDAQAYLARSDRAS